MSVHSLAQEDTAPHYRVPADYLFVPQVDFWEIICYWADLENGPFKLRLRDMMGLFSHPTFARARREALRGPAPPLIAFEEEGERFYLLRAQAAGWPDETLRKLRAYIERGWIVHLKHHRHAKWVLNYLLLERQRRLKSVQGTPDTLNHFTLTWMKLKRALEAAKGRKVEYRKLKDGFLFLERLGIVTPLTNQPTAKLGYGQRFQHRLNVPRLLEVAPRFLHRCQRFRDEPLTLPQAIAYILRLFTTDYRRPENGLRQTQPWTLDWLHGEVEVELEMEHKRRVPVRRELIWTAAGVLAQAGILRDERAGYALSEWAAEKSHDPTDLEAKALAALAQIQRAQEQRRMLSPSEIARLDILLEPCRRRDAGRAALTRDIVLQMHYPVEMAFPLFALLRRRMDRIPEERFPALLAHFANRQARGSFSLHPADILDDFTPRRKRDYRKQVLIVRKTLKGRRPVVQGQFHLPVAPGKIVRARLYCTLRHGRPLPAELTGQPLDICLCAGDRELYRATVPLLDIPDDPLEPADITGPLRALAGDLALTLRLTLPARLPALRLLARIEADVS